MRCLRSIGDIQETGHIYLSKENMQVLEDELQQNFRVTTEELGPKKEDDRVTVDVTAVPPPIVLTLKRRRELYQTKRKEEPDSLTFDLSEEALSRYRARVRSRRTINTKVGLEIDITDRLENRTFSPYTLVAELARYFAGDGISPFTIHDMLRCARPELDEVVAAVNMSNDVLYDIILPKVFYALFEIETYERVTEEQVELVKGYNPQSNWVPSFRFKAKPELLASRDFPKYINIKERSFHLDHYCFDSEPELNFFEQVLKLEEGDKIYFTGMLVHGQSGFRVNYIHPESHTVCNYYPDFLIIRQSGATHLIEVKSAWMANDPVVIAKQEAAERMASGNEFRYALLTKDDFPRFLDASQGWSRYVPRTNDLVQV